MQALWYKLNVYGDTRRSRDSGAPPRAGTRGTVGRCHISDNADLIIIGGGDGTISGAPPALIQLDRPIAILPLGTANDLARELGIPEDITAAAKTITGGDICRIDVGRANNQRDTKRDRNFLITWGKVL